MTYYFWVMISNRLRKTRDSYQGIALAIPLVLRNQTPSLGAGHREIDFFRNLLTCNYSAKKIAEKVRECFTPLLSIAGLMQPEKRSPSA